MSIRAAGGSMAVLCAVGLALIGVGWQGESRHRPAPPLVYCDIDSLKEYHPAWNQVAGMVAILSDGRKDLSMNAHTVVRSPILSGRMPVVESESRAALGARLRSVADQEMARIGSRLRDSLEGRLSERRRELEAQARAEEAEERRRSEQCMVEELRAVAEESKHERVSAAIKLAAARAQLSSRGIDRDWVEEVVRARQADLDSLRCTLDRDEQVLRAGIASVLAEAREVREYAAEQELNALRDEETRRIEELLSVNRSRMEREMNGNSLAGLANDWRSSSWEPLPVVEPDLAGRQATVAASDEFKAALEESADDLASYRQSLQERIETELRTVVRRIARENGLQVTFELGGAVSDRTEWFRRNLPYGVGSEQRRERPDGRD